MRVAIGIMGLKYLDTGFHTNRRVAATILSTPSRPVPRNVCFYTIIIHLRQLRVA